MAPEPTHGVVPALDVPSAHQALRLVEATRDVEGVAGYKISHTIVLEVGLVGAVKALRAVTDHPLYYDHQKAGLDVPSNGTAFGAAVAAAGVDGVIVFPIAGPTSARRFVRAALDHGVRAVVGAALPLPDFTVSGGGWVADDALLRVAGIAIDEGVTDFVVPAHDPAAIAAVTEELIGRHPDLRYFLPGIGALGGSIPDAFAAVRGRRALAVVGREIYGSSDPGEATRRLAGEALEFAGR